VGSPSLATRESRGEVLLEREPGSRSRQLEEPFTRKGGGVTGDLPHRGLNPDPLDRVSKWPGSNSDIVIGSPQFRPCLSCTILSFIYTVDAIGGRIYACLRRLIVSKRGVNGRQQTAPRINLLFLHC
jgi:hypothetical protein